MLAYYDTFSGLVPCTVLGVYPSPITRRQVAIRLRVNATRGAYKRGETIAVETISGTHCPVVPRSHVRGLRSRFNGARIISGYSWRKHVDWLAHARATRTCHAVTFRRIADRVL